MKVDLALREHVAAAFAPLNSVGSSEAFPAVGSLSKQLTLCAARLSPGSSGLNVSAKVAAMFATASVNMWLRSVHSFLISAGLTGVSPIWASVAGYYSSHYSIRALAHLLGFFQLYSQKRIVQLSLVNGKPVCTFVAKNGSDREHRLYWRIVKQNILFSADPLFTNNTSGSTTPVDVDHRDHANYADHLAGFPTFRPLDATATQDRIERISNIELSTPPIPRAGQYPDLESVQIVAYHRLVRFRELLDCILGSGNRFWSAQRYPSWARGFVDYQITEMATLGSHYQ